MHWLYLFGAILSEIIATSALKAADGFTHPVPTAITVAGYVVAFFCLSVALRTIPMGIAYALWSGIGIVAISLAALFLYRQTLDTRGAGGDCADPDRNAGHQPVFASGRPLTGRRSVRSSLRASGHATVPARTQATRPMGPTGA